jgi:ATP-dependent Lhr-like helicase
MPRKAESHDLKELQAKLFDLTEKEVDSAFNEYLKARFPFNHKMKFIAERFGAMQRGKTLSHERLEQLPVWFKDTPIYEETLREVLLEKVDIPTVKNIMQDIKEGKTKVYTQLRIEKPSPLAYHILEKYAEVPELMAPERVLLNNIERMKRTVIARKVHLLCLSCGAQMKENHIRNMPEKPICEKCGSNLLAHIRMGQDPEVIRDILKRRLDGKELSPEELEQLSHARRTADLILSYGKKALIAFQVKGIGPETAFRLLGKMHYNEDEFYMDLLKSKIQYLRTRQYWEDKEKGIADYKPKSIDI